MDDRWWLNEQVPSPRSLSRPGDALHEGHQVDEAAYRRLIKAVLDDVDGVVVAGTTGEFVYLSLRRGRGSTRSP